MPGISQTFSTIAMLDDRSGSSLGHISDPGGHILMQLSYTHAHLPAVGTAGEPALGLSLHGTPMEIEDMEWCMT